MLKYVSFYISLISILPFLLFGCNSATQQTEKVAPQTEATEAPTQPSTEVSNATESPSSVESTPSVAKPAKKIAPGEMFKLAFNDKARIELIRVNRIENRNSGKKDLINIQYQVRKIDDGVATDDVIAPEQLKALS
ncbi:hypothetical protein [Chamaesiphon sp.]|uniref:hypothetical protein n=1 Tax=Chamaesiphon sp. TaxID=2814140 RepID=UPI00359384B7